MRREEQMNEERRADERGEKSSRPTRGCMHSFNSLGTGKAVTSTPPASAAVPQFPFLEALQLSGKACIWSVLLAQRAFAK